MLNNPNNIGHIALKILKVGNHYKMLPEIFILLITTNYALTTQVKSILPPLVDVKQTDSIVSAEKWLHTNNRLSASDLFLIIYDATLDIAGIHECCQLRQSFEEDVPLIVIIDSIDTRDQALELGADDYLLYPFSSRELQVRLGPYLQRPLYGVRALYRALQTDYAIGSNTPSIQNGLKNIALMFDASAAWLWTFDDPKEGKLLSEYHAPPFIQQLHGNLKSEFPCLQKIFNPSTEVPSPIVCDCLSHRSPPETNNLSYHLMVPMPVFEQKDHVPSITGVLVLAFSSLPIISALEKWALKSVGQSLGVMLKILSIQHQMQTYAIQNAFLVLLTRQLNEYRAGQSGMLFSQILEQILPLFSAVAGVIWILSDDRQSLKQVAYLSTLGYTISHQPRSRSAEQGVLGVVLRERRSIQLSAPADASRFDLSLDDLDNLRPYTLLAVPIQYHDIILGVISVYKDNGTAFSAQDIMLLESIASLVASTMVHNHLLKKMHEHGQRQTVLYEMGQQISTTLNLSTTLRRTLQWTARLTGAELGLLWLVQVGEEKQHIRLAAVMGVNLPPKAKILFSPDHDLSAKVLQTREVLIFNTIPNDPHSDSLLRNILQPVPRNLIAAPVIHHGQIIGLLELFDKSNGDFTEEDRLLLTTALKMISLAIGNAYLYEQTQRLQHERNRLQQQIIQSERLATIGRLTAVLAHEINNPMQAIQGALMLAQEELGNPTELQNYLNIGLQESERVINLVRRMRQLYRPEAFQPERLDVGQILQAALDLGREELERRKITLHTQLAPNLPHITAMAGQLHLVFLNLLLNFGDAIGEKGGNLYIRTQVDANTNTILITFSAEISPAFANQLASLLTATPALPLETSLSFGLSFSRDFIIAHNGRLDITQKDRNIICTIQLPVQE